MNARRVQLVVCLVVVLLSIAALFAPQPPLFSQTSYVNVTPSAAGVSASTSDTNLPANTVDGNHTTRWSANGDGAWIRYDLGTSRTVGFVNVGVYQGNARRWRFDIQVSGDGATWGTVFANAQSGGTTTGLENLRVP